MKTLRDIIRNGDWLSYSRMLGDAVLHIMPSVNGGDSPDDRVEFLVMMGGPGPMGRIVTNVQGKKELIDWLREMAFKIERDTNNTGVFDLGPTSGCKGPDRADGDPVRGSGKRPAAGDG